MPSLNLSSISNVALFLDTAIDVLVGLLEHLVPLTPEDRAPLSGRDLIRQRVYYITNSYLDARGLSDVREYTAFNLQVPRSKKLEPSLAKKPPRLSAST